MAWLNGNAMFFETFICFNISDAKSFVSVFVHKCLMILNNVEYTTFKMFVMEMINYLFVISFQLMFYKTLRYRLARAKGSRKTKLLMRSPYSANLTDVLFLLTDVSYRCRKCCIFLNFSYSFHFIILCCGNSKI